MAHNNQNNELPLSSASFGSECEHFITAQRDTHARKKKTKLVHKCFQRFSIFSITLQAPATPAHIWTELKQNTHNASVVVNRHKIRAPPPPLERKFPHGADFACARHFGWNRNTRICIYSAHSESVVRLGAYVRVPPVRTGFALMRVRIISGASSASGTMIFRIVAAAADSVENK